MYYAKAVNTTVLMALSSIAMEPTKALMNNPATAEVWQTAFGKDFGGMAQGNNKTGQRGTNAMFVMTRDEVAHALAVGQFFTYANSVVNYQPQKEDLHRI